jgi:hypothetical protein
MENLHKQFRNMFIMILITFPKLAVVLLLLLYWIIH